MDRRRPITLLLRLPNMKILQRIKIIELDGISDYYGAGTWIAQFDLVRVVSNEKNIKHFYFIGFIYSKQYGANKGLGISQSK